MVSAVQEYVDLLRMKFRFDMIIRRLRFGGTVTVDGIHLKVQGNCFYHFRPHHIEVIEKAAFEEAVLVIRTETLLIAEGPSVPNASNIRSAIADGLREKYDIDLYDFKKEFTMVTVVVRQ